MAKLVAEAEDYGINVQELLESLDDDQNSSIIKYTTKKINKEIRKMLGELGINEEEINKLALKLNGYRFVDELPDINYGCYIRWISLKEKNMDNIKLTNGGILCDINILKNGIHLKCKNRFNKFFQIKF